MKPSRSAWWMPADPTREACSSKKSAAAWIFAARLDNERSLRPSLRPQPQKHSRAMSVADRFAAAQPILSLRSHVVAARAAPDHVAARILACLDVVAAQTAKDQVGAAAGLDQVVAAAAPE